jgi:hypothetical protein
MSSELDKLTANQKLQLLNELYELGAHAMWEADAIVEWFSRIGVDCRLDSGGRVVIFLGERIEPVRGEWGKPGIYAPALLSVVIKKARMEIHHYGLSGKGVIHRDHIHQLAQFWGLGDRYEHPGT